jgi:hypothetical protein
VGGKAGALRCHPALLLSHAIALLHKLSFTCSCIHFHISSFFCSLKLDHQAQFKHLSQNCKQHS